MPVIALCMEMGTYDDDFGVQLATSLGLRLIDMRSLERDAMERYELGGGVVERFVAGRIPWVKNWQPTPQQLAARIKELTLESAERGDVLILGWSPAAILSQVAQVLRVRIVAPPSWRERVVAEKLRYRYERTAKYEIASVDGLLLRFVQHLADADWTDPSLYHLEIKADVVATDAACRLVGLHGALPPFLKREQSVKEMADILARLRASELDDGIRGNRSVDVGDGDPIPLAKGTTHEQAIALIERHLHGGRPV